MSRSKKKPIVKDNAGKKGYWKQIRSVINQAVRKVINDPDAEEEIPKAQEIINDYTYSDYKFVSKKEKDKRK